MKKADQNSIEAGEKARISTKQKTSCKHETETMRIKANCKKREEIGADMDIGASSQFARLARFGFMSHQLHSGGLSSSLTGQPCSHGIWVTLSWPYTNVHWFHRVLTEVHCLRAWDTKQGQLPHRQCAKGVVWNGQNSTATLILAKIEWGSGICISLQYFNTKILFVMFVLLLSPGVIFIEW